jgi:hypothetical protein
MAVSIHPLRPGMTVQVILPLYATGEVGQILDQEPGSDRWLVKVAHTDMLLSLLPGEFVPTVPKGTRHVA